MATLGYTSGLRARYRAGSLSLNNDDVIAPWTDESGNGNHATAGAGPIFKTNQINGQPAAYFDGTKYLNLPYAAIGSGLTEGEVFVVCKMSDNAGQDVAPLNLWGGTSGYGGYDHYPYNNAIYSTVFRTDRTNFTRQNDLTAWHYYGVEAGGGFWAWRHNGAVNQSSSGTFGVAGGYLGQDVAAGNRSTCYVAEILIYDHRLDAEDRLTVQNYLYEQYGIGSAFTQERSYTTFAGETAGTLPADWDYAGTASGTAQIVNDVTATDGKLLRFVGANSNYPALIFKGLVGASDIDVIARVRLSDLAVYNYMWGMHGLNPASSWSKGGEFINSTGKLFSSVDAGGTDLGSLTGLPTLSANTWFWRRIRLQGGILQAKQWLGDVGDEPVGWNGTAYAGSADLYGGIGARNATIDLDIIGIGTNGATAPTGPLSTSLTAETGVFSLTGQDADLIHGRIMRVARGLFGYSGMDAGLSTSKGISAETGIFSLAGQDAELSGTKRLSADTGIFHLIGKAANLRLLTDLEADTGLFNFEGQEVTFRSGFGIIAETGIFGLVGSDIEIREFDPLTPLDLDLACEPVYDLTIENDPELDLDLTTGL